ncbi:MAG TPA: hypothetical protein VHZ25_07570 [Acidobacteriaceae bacterium]|jgi:hypothetical protein|nr:hypothetical protein [Acidobacteriaceae bacterium]
MTRSAKTSRTINGAQRQQTTVEAPAFRPVDPAVKKAWALAPALIVLFLILVPPAHAHVGSPDVYAEGNAGPYKLSVVIRPPLVIPGVAEVDIRVQSAGASTLSITPLALVGEASKHPPTPDIMKVATADPNYFTGQLWIMAPGSWQIRIAVDGDHGHGVWSVPLPAVATGTRGMQHSLGIFLSILGIVLIIGMTGIVGAASRDAQLAPDETPTPKGRRSAAVSMTVAFAVLVGMAVLGNWWWKSEAASYSAEVYKPLGMDATVTSGNLLDLKVKDSGWILRRHVDDFIPDHNHLVHLYMIRWPQMDVVFHLHPQFIASGEFQLPLPSVPAGDYHLYADVVHASGFPETMVSAIVLPPTTGRPLSGDDAEGQGTPVSSAPSNTTSFLLPDRYTMVWNKPATLIARQPIDFAFTLNDRSGHPAQDTQLYMGMLGHAAFIKDDGTVFAHIHPSGTVAMAALMMAESQNAPAPATPAGSAPASDMSQMPGMIMSTDHLPSSVSFPYGFPTSGRYRIIVQMKHAATIETGIFDAAVQ